MWPLMHGLPQNKIVIIIIRMSNMSIFRAGFFFKHFLSIIKKVRKYILNVFDISSSSFHKQDFYSNVINQLLAPS